MNKIKIENRSSNERFEVPVTVNDYDDVIEVGSNDEEFGEAIEKERRYKLIAVLILICTCAIGLVTLFSKPSIEDYRKQNLKEAEALFKSYGLQYNNAVEKVNTLSGKISEIRECTKYNSFTGTAYECDLNFNK